jgi:hypothetical protein
MQDNLKRSRKHQGSTKSNEVIQKAGWLSWNCVDEHTNQQEQRLEENRA